MAYKSLQQFVETLEAAGELVRIKTYVDPVLEITEITDRVSKNDGPALLFENTGTGFPLLINSMGSYKRMCMAMGVEQMDDATREIESLFEDLTAPKNSFLEKLSMLPKLGKFASWMPKVKSGKGACQQVVMEEPDLSKLPIMKCWPHDGGRYITLPVIHTKDPETDARNVGMYRVQVFEKDKTALHWQLHKVSRRHYEAYKKAGKRMPVAIALGGDPLYSYAATAPLPDGIDEYILAGFLRKKRVELVKCLTQPDIEVPADADIIIEGYVDTSEELIWEGPFGDHTGYYSLADWYPAFHVTAITHRKDAIYPSTIVGIPPQEDAWIGKATERIFLAPIKMTMVQEIVDMVLPIEGVFHNMAIIKINKEFPGQALKVMNSMWGAGQMMFTKMMLIVDQHAPDLEDYEALARYVSENIDVEHDLVLSKGPIDVLDHSCSSMAFGGKLGLDGTRKLPEELQQRAENTPTPATGQIDVPALKAQFPEIASVNTRLLDKGISLVLIGIYKTRKKQVKKLARKLFEESDALKDVKVAIVLDHNVDVFEVADAVWRFSNNTDVKRDSVVIDTDEGHGTAHLVLDGTRKLRVLDEFQREWPNILVMSDEVIEIIDEKWSSFGLGNLLPSPSRKYKGQLNGGDAVAAEPTAEDLRKLEDLQQADSFSTVE